MVFDKCYLIKSISAVTNYNSSSCSIVYKWFFNSYDFYETCCIIICVHEYYYVEKF